MDGRSESQLFLPEKGVLTEFALRTLLPVFPIHTKSRYQFQEAKPSSRSKYCGSRSITEQLTDLLSHSLAAIGAVGVRVHRGLGYST